MHRCRGAMVRVLTAASRVPHVRWDRRRATPPIYHKHQCARGDARTWMDSRRTGNRCSVLLACVAPKKQRVLVRTSPLVSRAGAWLALRRTMWIFPHSKTGTVAVIRHRSPIESVLAGTCDRGAGRLSAVRARYFVQRSCSWDGYSGDRLLCASARHCYWRWVRPRPGPRLTALASVTTAMSDTQGFTPSQLNITVGDSVQFYQYADTVFTGAHNVVADDGSFRCATGCDGEGGDGTPVSDSSCNAMGSCSFTTIGLGFTRTFPTPGIVVYHDEISHASGVIVVQGVEQAAVPVVSYSTGIST